MATHTIRIGTVTRELPLRELSPEAILAIFDSLGDWELTEAAGKELAKLVPANTSALIMPDGKATALLHVLGRETGLPTYVARKELKPYMGKTIAVAVVSITTRKPQTLYLGEDVATQLAGKSVAIVDDVVSSGATLTAMAELLRLVGATHSSTLAVFTEDVKRPDVIALGHLPNFSVRLA